jgi:hypothetical protein
MSNVYKPKDYSEEENNLTLLEGDIIFKKLVLEGSQSQTGYNKIVGMIAYCQYVIRKYQYLEKSKRDNGTYPTEDMLKKHTKFWNSVWANLVSSFIYSLIIGAIIFSATASLPNTKFSRIIKILFENTEVNSK